MAFMGSIRALLSVSALSSLPSRMIELVQAVCASRALCVAERSSRAVRSRLAESGHISWIFDTHCTSTYKLSHDSDDDPPSLICARAPARLGSSMRCSRHVRRATGCARDLRDSAVLGPHLHKASTEPSGPRLCAVGGDRTARHALPPGRRRHSETESRDARRRAAAHASDSGFLRLSDDADNLCFFNVTLHYIISSASHAYPDPLAVVPARAPSVAPPLLTASHS